MMRRRSTIFLALTLSTTGALAPVYRSRASASEAVDAQRAEADQKARASYVRGEAAFNAAHYEQALAEFEAGYAESPRPGFLLNIAHTWRKLGDLRKARATYKKYLLVEPNSKNAADVQALIAEIDSTIAEEDPPPRASSSSGCRNRPRRSRAIDGRRKVDTPAAGSGGHGRQSRPFGHPRGFRHGGVCLVSLVEPNGIPPATLVLDRRRGGGGGRGGRGVRAHGFLG